jgi:DNA repair exonuclease SbcCD ATPase subunit
LGQLPVEVIQVTSDEAKALIKHAEEKMKAHHGPDLFHPLHDLGKAMSGSLAVRVRSAQQQLEAATQHRRQCEEQEAHKEAAESPNEAPSTEDKAPTAAKKREAQAQEQLDQAKRQQAEMRQAIRGISDSYHPFDRQTGAVRQAEQVAQDIEEHFQTIDRLAQETAQSQRALARIEKTRRVVPRMISTISFVHATVRSWVEDLGLPEEVEQLVHESWIPGRYLELAARRAPRAESRRQLRYGARYVAPSPEQLNDRLACLDRDQRTVLEQVVEQAAQLFQRSSSAVEGRNGHLSLFHHGHHRLPQRKLTALTVLHNYFKVRDDETTAAERLTGHPPTDLILWLLERIPLPARPARSRRQQSA